MKHRSTSDIKDIDNRLATIEGHVKGIRQMLLDGKDCEELLLQLCATSGAIKKLSKKILSEHLNSCVKESILNNEEDKLEHFIEIVEKYL